MIANARMYSVSSETAGLWRRLLAAVIERAGGDICLVEHADPLPISELWQRTDKAAVFMCGLPFSRSDPRPELIAAPVPSLPEFCGLPQYWSEMVVRKDSVFQTIEDTFGGRIALTSPDSQSGCIAALQYLITVAHEFPLFREVIAPQFTPLRALSAVIDGSADVAPIDSYAYRLLRKYRSDLTSQVRVIAGTQRRPIPPLVASRGGFEPLQAAFLGAHDITAAVPLMAGLLLERFVRPDPDSYDVLRSNFDTVTRYWSENRLAMTVHPAFVAYATPVSVDG